MSEGPITVRPKAPRPEPRVPYDNPPRRPANVPGAPGMKLPPKEPLKPVEAEPVSLEPERVPASKSLAPEDKQALRVGRFLLGLHATLTAFKKNWWVGLLVAIGTGVSALRTGNAPENAEKAIGLQELRAAADKDRDAKLASALKRIDALERQTECYQKLFAGHFRDILPEPKAMVWSPNVTPVSWQDTCAELKP